MRKDIDSAGKYQIANLKRYTFSFIWLAFYLFNVSMHTLFMFE